MHLLNLLKKEKFPYRNLQQKEAPTGASFQKGRIKYYRIFRKIKGGDPMIVVVCPGFVGLYIPDWYFFVVFEDELLYTMINNSVNRWTAWLLAGKAVHLLSG